MTNERGSCRRATADGAAAPTPAAAATGTTRPRPPAPAPAGNFTQQARNALSSMARHQQSEGLPPEACSVVVCGDLNEGPRGSVAHLLQHGWAPVPSGGAQQQGGRLGGGSAASSAVGLAGLADDGAEATQPYLLQVRGLCVGCCGGACSKGVRGGHKESRLK
jgi:hypothetical protein